MKILNKVLVDYSKVPLKNFRPVTQEYYIDETRKCRNCSKNFVMTADHKKYLSENLKLVPEVVHIYCMNCRNILTALKLEIVKIDRLLKPKGRKQNLSIEQIIQLQSHYELLDSFEGKHKSKLCFLKNLVKSLE